jgi:hypothetical protein
MRVEGACGGHGNPLASPGPDRRGFLRAGAACAMPLLAGGVLTSRGMPGGVETGAGPAERDASDPVLTHVQQELARTCHAVRGPAGIRGEHVRALAANLDLIGVCLQSAGSAPRADAALRRRIEEKGREATAEECLAAFDDLAVEMNLQFGVIFHPGRDPSRAAAAIDSVAAWGSVSTVRGHRAALHRLAASIDRADLMRGGTARPLAVCQKPGDDFLGYPPGSALDGLTLCQHLEALQWALEVLAAFLALMTSGAAAGALALAAIVLDLIKLLPCKQDVEP